MSLPLSYLANRPDAVAKQERGLLTYRATPPSGNFTVCELWGGCKNSLRRPFALRYSQSYSHSADVPDERGQFTSHGNDCNLAALSSGDQPAISATQA
jgi:hypothetical protein